MTRIERVRVRIAVAFAMSTGVLGAGPAAYGQSGAAERTSLEEIVVTARRQAESLQDAPVSITALSAATIEAAGIEDLRDVARLAPGLRFDDLIAGLFASPVIRGLSVSNLLSENNVGTFIDGVYISNKAGLDLSLTDLERIEVIKGPQSALYGRNTFAGAINYVTRPPGDTPRGRARVTLGEDGLLQGGASLSGPIGDAGFKAGLSGLYGTYDGAFREAVSGDDLGGYDRWAVNLTLRFEPSESLVLGAGVYYGEDELGPTVIARLANNCATLPMTTTFSDYCGAVPDLEDVRVEASTRSPLLQPNDRSVLLANLTLDLAIGGGWRLQSLTGYNDVDSVSYGEFDRRQNGGTFALVGGGTTLANVWLGENNAAEDLSEELRLSSPQDRRLRGSVGAFYYDSDSVRATPVSIDGSQIPAGRSIASPFAYLVTPNGTPVPTSSLDTAGVRQVSGFGTLEGDVGERLTLTGELRYTEERKRADSIRNVFAGGADLDGPGQSETFSFTDARAVARWKISDSATVYVSAASGHKSGGFNSGALNPAERTYDPERNWTYEIGAKTEWADSRVRLNGAVYFVDWRDVQLSVPQNSASPASIIQNAGQVEATGIELELTARPGAGLELGLGVAVGSPEFVDSYTTQDAASCALIPGCRTEIRPFGGVNRLVAVLDGNTLPRAYREQGYLYVDYTRPLGTRWSAFGRADWSYAGRDFDRAINTSYIPSRSLVDLRLGMRDASWTITLFAENLLDDTTPTAATRQTDLATFQNFLDIVGGQRRRSIGATVTYEF